MHFRTFDLIRLMLFGLILGTSCVISQPLRGDTNDNHRYTPLVRAVQDCRLSVVNLRGRKTVPTEPDESDGQKLKQVNGMGTGVVIDSRGLILTNYHVVQGVREIEVTTSDKQKTTAQLLAHDPETDLAILKIDLNRRLPKINIGSSSDLMLAETVIAVGNAYGYEHTVTVGIVSQIGRTVQVNDNQIYKNLIQTDTAINPGNSGGPLLNLNGEMIGINVAVRIGAQGIAFAIPVNDAIEVAAKLLAEIGESENYHGLITSTRYKDHKPRLVVDSVAQKSPAAQSGLSAGDQILAIQGDAVQNSLDLQCALYEMAAGKTFEVTVKRGSSTVDMVVALNARDNKPHQLAWNQIGLSLRPVGEGQMTNLHPNYKRGLRVTRVRPDSPAEKEGIMPGDIVVAMHGYKTESMENLAYILQQADVRQRKSFMFYILRDKEPFWGQMRVARNLTTR